MRFAASPWLFGTLFALLVGVLFVISALLLVRALRRLGDEPLILSLITDRVGPRRALKAALFVVAVALAFVALARPQYGRGTRLVPATNLDVVIALDYSKSMYAADIAPSRSLRAKTEVSRLIDTLRGARFGAVAFAGEPTRFPLTSDGAAIAQFFRQLTPNDVTPGGTSLSRALEASRDLLAHDPLSKKHAKVIVLVTDGEDLEGDPVAVARAARDDGITVHVIQIGGRTPEPIPEVGDDGRPLGIRRDAEGKPLTTALSAEGEAQLTEIANVTGGRIVRSSSGNTGIEQLTAVMSRWVNEELSERVETVYADVYHYPLGLAVLLLLLETFVPETRRQRSALTPPQPSRRPRRRNHLTRSAVTLLGVGLLVLNVGCRERAERLFLRNAPEVDQAITLADADAGASLSLLSRYLMTGECEKGNIGTPESFEKKPNAAWDLGAVLFRVAESHGARFEEVGLAQSAGATPQGDVALRGETIDCALRVTAAVALLPEAGRELRARADFLTGNLRFLREEWQEALLAYDRALRLVPGLAADAGETLGRDIAFNRALALRNLKEKPPPDGGTDGGNQPPDAGHDPSDAGDQPPDAGHDPSDGGNQPPDAGQDPPDAGHQPPDAASPSPNDQEKNDSEPAPQPSQNQPTPPPSSPDQDERVLDMLEKTPILGEHEAKPGTSARARSGMEDK